MKVTNALITLLFKPSTFLGLLFWAILFVQPANANLDIMARVPNTNVFQCKTCHQVDGGSPLNLFGSQVQSYLSWESDNPVVDWSNLWEMDADNDGQKNGQELGDPCGSWSFGTSTEVPRTENVSHPGCNPADAIGSHYCTNANFLPYITPDPNGGTPIWYYDGDGDTIGRTTQSAILCEAPEDYVALGGDCDDTAPEITTFIWYEDFDGDTWGNPDVSSTECIRPDGYVAVAGDCNDNNEDKYEAIELYVDVDTDGYGAGESSTYCVGDEENYPSLSLDGSDCAPTDITSFQYHFGYLNEDGDAFSAGTLSGVCAGDDPPANMLQEDGVPLDAPTEIIDCDDNNGNLYLEMPLYADGDGDLYTLGAPLNQCTNGEPPSGFLVEPYLNDCDDGDPTKFQLFDGYKDADFDGYTVGTVEAVCSGLALPGTHDATQSAISDCDDSEETGANVYRLASAFVDDDGDNYTVGDQASLICIGDDMPPGFAGGSLGVDCDDNVSAFWEWGNAWVDMDRDGYGIGAPITQCVGDEYPDGWAPQPGDCQDNNSLKFELKNLYEDKDHDGWGWGEPDFDCWGSDPPDSDSTFESEGYDCDDTDPNRYTQMIFYEDLDGDNFGTGFGINICASDNMDFWGPQGWALVGEDCDDADPNAWSNLVAYQDSDGDGITVGAIQYVCTAGNLPNGWSSTPSGNDCNDDNLFYWRYLTGYADFDADGVTKIIAEDVCSGEELPPQYLGLPSGNDCDDDDVELHKLLAGYHDNDNDGYGAGEIELVCSGATLRYGYVQDGTDCDDTVFSQYRGLALYHDLDGDGKTDPEVSYLCLGEHIPAGYFEIPEGADCDDENPFIWNGFNIWWDNDQDGFTDLGAVMICIDDTMPVGAKLQQSILTDCDDNNATLYPIRCQDVNAQCGDILDGCGGIKNCGGCYEPDICGGGGVSNQCGCSPITCEMAGAECGSVPDTCDHFLACGECFGVETCGGGGIPNRCGCTPFICDQLPNACGETEDGCGGIIDCGPCLEIADGGPGVDDGGTLWDDGGILWTDGGVLDSDDAGEDPYVEPDPPWGDNAVPGINSDGDPGDDDSTDDGGCTCEQTGNESLPVHLLFLLFFISRRTRHRQKKTLLQK